MLVVMHSFVLAFIVVGCGAFLMGVGVCNIFRNCYDETNGYGKKLDLVYNSMHILLGGVVAVVTVLIMLKCFV